MPIKGNQFRPNTVRNGSSERTTSGKRPLKREGRAEQIPVFKFSGSKVAKISGLFLLLITIYFLVAFISYLFTWQSDQSFVSAANGGWSNLLKSHEELVEVGVQNPVVENWLGKFGALLSHQFIYKWFGIASFIFLFVFFAIGHRLLFRIKILPLAKALGYSFFFLIFISVSLGYLHGFMSNYPHFLEGEFGFWTNRLMQVQLGSAGVGALLIFVFLSFLVIAYNMDFKVNFTLPERKKTRGSPDAISDDLEIEKDNHPNEKDEVHERRSQQTELNPRLRRDRSDDPVATVNSTYDRKGTTGLNILEDATVLTGEGAVK